MGLNLGGGFARGVLQGQSIFQSFHDQYERGQQKRDLAEIASAKTEDSVGFTPEQGQQINELAANGYKIDFDAANKAYTAKNDSGDTKTIAMGGVTDFMGKRTTRVSEDAARINAMADVFGRTDPFKATQLRSQARREERDRIRDSREDKQWARDDALLKIDEEMGRTFQNSLKNADGTARVATADDHLANMQQRISRYSGAGFSKEAEALMREHYSMANVKLQMEGKERENAATKVVGLLDAGDPSGVVDYYNKYMPTGDKLTGVEVGKDGSVLLQRTGLDGKPGEPLRAKSIEDLKRTIVGSVDYKQAYQISQDMFRNNLSLKQDARADNADVRDGRRLDEQIRHNRAQEGRAAATHAMAMADRNELRNVREALARESDPNLTQTQIRAIRAGLIQTPGADKSNVKYEFDPTRLHKMFGETSVDPLTGKETVKRNPAEEKKFMEYMGDNPAIRDLDEGLVKYNRAKTQAEKKERAQQPPKISGAAEYAKLPSGARFTDPNGDVRVKP